MKQASKLATFADFVANPNRDIEIFGMFGAGNLGDEAMLVAAKEQVGEGRCVPWKYYSNKFLNKIVLSVKHQRLFVVGGTLIHGGKKNWLDYVEHRFKQKVPVSFFGTGIAFTDDQVLEKSDSFKRWSNILRNCSNVYLRGSASVEMAGRMGSSAEIFGDFAFLLHDPALCLSPTESRKDIIGLNFGECLGDQEDFEEKAARMVRILSSRHELAFHAVVQGDVPVILRIAALAGLALSEDRIQKHYFDPRAFMGAIRQYRAFLGLKLHAAGLAMIAGVPSLMIAYRPKARDFMTPLGRREDLILDLPLDVERILERLSDLLDDPEAGILTDRIGEICNRQKQIMRNVILEG